VGEKDHGNVDEDVGKDRNVEESQISSLVV